MSGCRVRCVSFLGGATVYQAGECRDCRGSGYKGRSAIFEMFTVNDRIRELIIGRAGGVAIRAEAARMGMRTLHQSGLERVRQGDTSLAEVYRVARDETIDMSSWLSE